MICAICKEKATGKLSADLDIGGVGFCKKHRKEVYLSYYILVYEGIEAFYIYIKEQKNKNMRTKIEFYKGKKAINWIKGNRWRWRLIGGNGEIICGSTEGFYSKSNAKRNAMLTRDRLNQVL